VLDTLAAVACTVAQVVVVEGLVGTVLVVGMVSVVVVVVVHVLFHGVRLVIVVTRLITPFVAVNR